ncbi:MAG: nuclear transport factor 2 family protein [Gemmatimonadaceae bacterium]|uniref:nuclear transport factor 2 family protein n=1 Tax=Caulobacter sp. DWP3-1-3b2 TaxID=2804643 RepID=UPI0019C8023B|nr:nuclear transport factor 2 family protein [Caulobacter sp.]
MEDAQALLTRFFDAYNRNDWVAFSTLVTADIDWPNQTGAGRVIGQDAMEAYWMETSRSIRVELAASAFAVQPDGRIAVDIHQTVHNASTGKLWSDTCVRHYYTFRDGLIARMDTEPLVRT